MKYNVSVVKKIALLMMTLALAVAMVACEAAAGKPGEPGAPGQPGAPGEPGGVPPSLDEAIGDVSLAASGSMATMDIDLSLHFYDPDGDDAALTYEATSSDTDTVTASVSGSTLSLTAVAVGTARITVQATDADGLSSGTARFDVTVAETVAPMVSAGGIPDQTLYVADGPQTLDLTRYFTHARTITYTVSTGTPGIVDVEVDAAGMLTLDPQVANATSVTVTATADEQSVSDEFIVTVMAGSEPEPVVPTPAAPMPEGTIGAQEVEEGKTSTMDVSSYFSPATGLTYTAMSDAEDKATVDVDGSNVTITGVAEGMATVTVTAADSDGRTATQSISVTVTPMMADHKPDMVTINAKGETEDISISQGQTLQSLNDAIVSVSRKAGNVWTLTGESKGSTTVRILRANGTVEKSISVMVKNSPPKLKDPLPSQRIALSATPLYDEKGMEIQDNGGTPIVITAIADLLDKVPYHHVVVPFSSYFEDGDGMDDIEKYVAVSAVPGDVEVVGSTKTGVVVNVIRKVGVSFALAVHAVDKAGGESGSATITVDAIAPHPLAYGVGQEKSDGILDPVTVMKRYGISHTLRVKPYKGTPLAPSGFNFVESFRNTRTRLVLDTISGDFASSHTGTPSVNPAAATVDSEPTADSTIKQYYTVKSTGSVLVDGDGDGLSFDSSNPQIKYKLKEGSSGSVVITYHVITCASDGAATPACTTGDDADYKWESVPKTLSVTIE